MVAVIAVVVATAILVVPGLVLVIVGRLRVLPALALGSMGAIAGIGGSGVVAGAAGIPFGPWVLAVVALGTAIVALLLRRRRPVDRRETLISALALAAGAVVVILVVAEPILSPDRFALNYDGVFHLNAVARILDTGDASSFTMYRVNNPGDDVEYYPAAWHALVALVCQLTGTSIPLGTSATWIATAIAVWLPGVAWLAASLAPRRPLLAGALGAVLGAAFAAAPYGLLSWGTLYPNGLAYALVPAGIALLMRVVDAEAPLRSRHRLLAFVGFVGWGVTEAFAHPRSLVTFAVIAVPLLAVVAVRLLARLARRPGGRRIAIGIAVGGSALLIALAGGAAWVVLRYFQAFDQPIADRLTGGPARATESLPGAIAQVLLQAPLVSPLPTMIVPAVGLALLTVAGFVVAARRRDLLWLPLGFAFLGILYVAAASSDSDLAKLLTGLWYKDKFRLSSALPILAVPAAALGAIALIDLVRRVCRLSMRRAVFAVAAVLVVLTTIPGLLSVRDTLHITFTIPGDKGGVALLDTDEYRLLQRLPELVPAGETVVGNPWNGSALTWAIGGRESLYPHLTGIWGPDRDLIAARLDLVADDPEACAALDRLGAHYLFASAGLLNGGDPTAVYWAAVDRAADAPGFTEVAREGESVLYRITACD